MYTFNFVTFNLSYTVKKVDRKLRQPDRMKLKYQWDGTVFLQVVQVNLWKNSIWKINASSVFGIKRGEKKF